MANTQARIVCFSCTFSWGYLADNALLADQHADWAAILCCGCIEPQQILAAFAQGAAGVLVAGCGNGECHFQDGNLQWRKRVALLRQVLVAHGIRPERLATHFGRDPAGAKLLTLVADFRSTLDRIDLIENRNDAFTVEVQS